MAEHSIDTLRRYAVSRSLFAPTTLPRALERFGFVQADPIRAPAVAQDLVLRHRVKNYTAGTLERRYPALAIEEDFFVNYGFVTPRVFAMMHPRTPRKAWTARERKQAEDILAFVRERGEGHPREVDAHFAKGRVTNWWGGQSSATTQLLDRMHYRGMVRVLRRERGVRVYGARDAMPEPMEPEAAMDALLDVVLAKYAPLPEASMRQLLTHLGGGAPQFREQKRSWFERAKKRLPSVALEGVRWYWPADELPLKASELERSVRFLAPFDPIVWDRRRFELLWGWVYRFEAYTPAAKRVRGYYAMPMLYGERVLGWANASVEDGALSVSVGFADKRPRDKALTRAIDEEIERLRAFLQLES